MVYVIYSLFLLEITITTTGLQCMAWYCNKYSVLLIIRRYYSSTTLYVALFRRYIASILHSITVRSDTKHDQFFSVVHDQMGV